MDQTLATEEAKDQRITSMTEPEKTMGYAQLRDIFG